MRYELSQWEKLAADPRLLASVSEAEARQELYRIRESIMDVLLNLEPDEAVCRFVRAHQVGILHLHDKLNGQGAVLGPCLDELSDCLERHAARYLDMDAPMPTGRSRHCLGDLEASLPLMKERLAKGGADDRLASLVLDLFAGASTENMTYRAWFMYRDLMFFLSNLPPADLGIRLPGLFSGWMFALARLTQKEAGEDRAAGENEDGFGLDSRKVMTSLTVSELGLLVRLFIEVGVFRPRNRKGLARFMAQNVVTLKKEATDVVSPNHLYGSLYTTTDPTMDSVQSILNRMLVRLSKLRLEQRKKKNGKDKNDPK